jgi:hypothetical protein
MQISRLSPFNYTNSTCFTPPSKDGVIEATRLASPPNTQRVGTQRSTKLSRLLETLVLNRDNWELIETIAGEPIPATYTRNMDSLLTSISINYPLTFLFNMGKIHGFLYSLTDFSRALKELKKEGINFSLKPKSEEVQELIRIFLQKGKNEQTLSAEALDYWSDKIYSLLESKTGQSGQSNPEPIPSASEVQAFIKEGVDRFS